MAGDAATNAASRVKPSQEHLDQLDRPAADNTWHDAPDFSKDNMKKQFQNVYRGDPKADAKDVMASANTAAHPTGSSDPRDLAGQVAQDQRTGTSSGVDAVGGAQAAVQSAQEKVDPEVRDKARQKKAEYRARAKDYLGRKVPRERREQTIWRLKVSRLSHACVFGVRN